MDSTKLKNIVEGALLASGQPLSVAKLMELFEEDQRPEKDEVEAAIQDLEADCRGRSVELKQVSSGYRLQVRQEYAPWISRLWEEKPKIKTLMKAAIGLKAKTIAITLKGNTPRKLKFGEERRKD